MSYRGDDMQRRSDLNNVVTRTRPLNTIHQLSYWGEEEKYEKTFYSSFLNVTVFWFLCSSVTRN